MSLTEKPVVMAELVAGMMTKWSEDYPGNVLVIATAYNKENLPPTMSSRFTIVELHLPDRAGVVDIFNKGAERLSSAVGRTGVLGNIAGFDSLAARMVELEWTTRNINEFLRRAYTLRSLEESWQPIDTPFLAAQMPPPPPRVGFRP